MVLYNKYFYQQIIRNYVIGFGSLFNNLYVVRKNSSGTEIEREIVPIIYSKKDKFITRMNQDGDEAQRLAIKLPRIGFEITDYSYDSARKLPSTKKVTKKNDNSAILDFFYNPVPYNISFNLYVDSKNQDEGLQIIEQILPFFTPDYTVTMKLTDLEDYQDIPISLVSVSSEDSYDGTFDERRSIVWTLSFVLRGYLFGPKRQTSRIFTSIINTYNAEYIEPVTTQDAATGMSILNSFEGDENSFYESYYYVELGASGKNFRFVRGTDATVEIIVKDSLGNDYNFVAGDTAEIIVRVSISSGVVITLPVTIVQDGLIRINIPSTTTLDYRSYIYQVNVLHINQSSEKIVEGFFAVTQ